MRFVLLFFTGFAYAAQCPVPSPICGATNVQGGSGAYCGVQGRLSGFIDHLGDPCVATLQQCRDACLENPDCNAFGWTSRNNICTLYGNTVSKGHFTPASGSMYFTYWNKSCFSNPTCLSPSSTAFCSSYLGIKPSTTTITSTTSPTVTVTADTTTPNYISQVFLMSTETDTITTTGTDTTTLDAATTTTSATFSFTTTPTFVSCVSVNLGTTQIQGGSDGPTATSGRYPCATDGSCNLGGSNCPNHVCQSRKRMAKAQNALARRAIATPSCLSGLPPFAISSACSCQSIAKPTKTKTITSAAPTHTVTTTPGYNTFQYFTVTTTITTTFTQQPIAYSNTVTLSTTITQVQPTPSFFPGMKYYQYPSNDYFGYSDAVSLLNYSDFANQNYGLSGYIQNLSFETDDYPNGSQCTLPGQTQSQDCSQYALVYQGFFFAPQSGTYYIGVPSRDIIDNFLAVWSGPNAYNYNWANGGLAYADFSVAREGSYADYTEAYQRYQFPAGELVPMTILWVNGGGAGRSFLQITLPDGTVHNDTSGFFLPPCAGSTAFQP